LIQSSDIKNKSEETEGTTPTSPKPSNLIQSRDTKKDSEQSIIEPKIEENKITKNSPIEIIPDINYGRVINTIDHGISGNIFPLEIESPIPLENVSCFEFSLLVLPKEHLYAGKNFFSTIQYCSKKKQLLQPLGQCTNAPGLTTPIKAGITDLKDNPEKKKTCFYRNWI